MIEDPALLLIDLQKSFCDPGVNGALKGDDAGEGSVQHAVERANAFADRYRERGRTPIFVRTLEDQATTHGDGDRDVPETAPPQCAPGSEAAEFADGIDVADDDVVVTKHHYSSFYGTDLEVYLSANDVSHVLVGGVNTHICVLTAAFDLVSRGYEVTVLSDCCGTSSVDAHESGIGILSTVADRVRSSTEIGVSGGGPTSADGSGVDA